MQRHCKVIKKHNNFVVLVLGWVTHCHCQNFDVCYLLWCCKYHKCDCSWIQGDSDKADTQLFQGVCASHPSSQHNPEVQLLRIFLCGRQRHWQILEQQHASCIGPCYQTQWIGEKRLVWFIRNPRVLWQVIERPASSNVTKTTKNSSSKRVVGRSEASAFPPLHRSKSGDSASKAASSWKHLKGILNGFQKMRWNLGLSRKGDSTYMLFL